MHDDRRLEQHVRYPANTQVGSANTDARWTTPTLWIALHEVGQSMRLTTMSIDTSKPFTRSAAIKEKITDDQLWGSDYRRIFQGVYVRTSTDVTLSVRARAALLVAPRGSYLSHHTAVHLWGGWAPPTPDTHVTSAGEMRSRRRGVRSHRAALGVVPRRHNGLLLAPPARAFLDLAGSGIALVDLVATGDSLVRAGAVTPAELITAASTWSGSGCRLARRAASYVREGVDSVMETRLRMLMVLAGLPEPTVNKIIRDADGRWIHRIDLCYSGLLLAIEYDGRQHIEKSAQWRSDIRRREDLERMGWTLIIIVAEDIYDHPYETLDRIRHALRDRGESAGRKRPPAEWYRCFPGRAAA